MGCVKQTQAVAKAMGERKWEEAVQLRGRSFQRNLETYRMLTRPRPKALPTGPGTGHHLLVMHVGAPCCGMNAAVRSFVRNGIASGNKVFAVHNGIEGLLADEVERMTWSKVAGWVVQGGALLGTKRTLPGNSLEQVAAQLKKYQIEGLLIIGGFEAFHSVLQLAEARDKYDTYMQ